MFDHRLGLAMGWSLQEVRSLPYPEWLSWWQFSLVEPFGWHDREYRTASVLSMLYNSNRGKKSKARGVSDFIRDLMEEMIKHIDRKAEEKAYTDNIEDANPEEKKGMIARMLGSIFGSNRINIQ